jgi:hypothetical protein
MKVTSTRDVSLEILRGFALKLARDIEVEVDESQTVLLAAEPPSWVVFLAEADWWLKCLAAYGALYIAEIVKEAGKATWKGLSNLASAKKKNKLNRLADEVAELRGHLKDRTRIEIGLPVPDHYFATRLELQGADPAEIAAQIALFLHHIPALKALIESESLDKGKVATGIFLKLRQDGALEVSWHEWEILEKQQRVIPVSYEA